MKCPYETLVKSGWVFKDICKVDFKQYDGLWYNKAMSLLSAKVDLPEDHCLPSSPSLGTPCCPSLPQVSSIMKANTCFVELVLNGCMITSSGTGVRGRVDSAIWECLLTAIIYAHVFCSSARKFILCTESHTGTDQDEGWKTQRRLAPIPPCFLLSPSAHCEWQLEATVRFALGVLPWDWQS